MDSQSVPLDDTTPEADQRVATPGYFEAMGISLLRGRLFEARDSDTAPPVAIVDETLAQTFWPQPGSDRQAAAHGRPQFHDAVVHDHRRGAARSQPDSRSSVARGGLLA